MFELNLDAWLVVVGVIVAWLGWWLWLRSRDLAWPRDRTYALGLGSTLVEGGASATIGARSRVRFRPDRLIMPCTEADGLYVTDVRVGEKNQLSTAGLSVEAFVESGGIVFLLMDAAEVGERVSVSVVNQGKEARKFYGAVVGPEVGKRPCTTSR